jgi:DNA-directed RNA polymerase specialized sigma subunit
MNLVLRLAMSFMDKWTSQLAEYVLIAIQNPNLSQEEIGQKLGINQAAVSRRRKRAHFDLMMESNDFYVGKIKQIN